MKNKRWNDFSPVARIAIVVAAALQFMLAGAAWADLAHRPAEAVSGRKSLWGLAIFVNFLGPLAYFRWGRIRPGQS